jgi:hypothetical protein
VKSHKPPAEQLDLDWITAEVASRHGVTLKRDDPAMVLVTINERVLESCFGRLENRARGLIAELDAAFEDMQQRESTRLTDEVHAAGIVIRQEIQRDIEAARLEAREAVFKLRSCYSRTVVHRWIAVGIVCAVVLLGLGFALGRMF